MVLRIYRHLDGSVTFRPSELAEELLVSVNHGTIDQASEPKINFESDMVFIRTTLSADSAVALTAKGVYESAKDGTWGFAFVKASE